MFPLFPDLDLHLPVVLFGHDPSSQTALGWLAVGYLGRLLPGKASAPSVLNPHWYLIKLELQLGRERVATVPALYAFIGFFVALGGCAGLHGNKMIDGLYRV